MNHKMKALLKFHEGIKLKPYYCTANKLTIGYGRNLESNGLTEEEAEFLLSNDLKRITAELSKHRFFTLLNDVRQGVLINMAYNMGVNGVLGFKKMIFFLDLGKYEQAGMEMMNSKWANQLGGRARKLAEIMEKGTYEETL